jgi:phosphocarrier protein NPr
MIEIREQLTLKNKLGLHARAAVKLVELTAMYDAEVTIIKGDKQASAASVLGLLVLESAHGQSIEVSCAGPDAIAAMAAVKELVEARFNESE